MPGNLLTYKIKTKNKAGFFAVLGTSSTLSALAFDQIRSGQHIFILDLNSPDTLL